MSLAGYAQGAQVGAQLVAAGCQIASTAMAYQRQKENLAHLDRTNTRAYNFQMILLAKESELMADVEDINMAKNKDTEGLARAARDNAIAKARYTEARKTNTATRLNLQGLLAQRNKAFYGSPVSHST